MKEYCKKFSEEPEDERKDAWPNERNQADQQRPEFRDLRFVVKESYNLGIRMISEIENMLRKLQE